MFSDPTELNLRHLRAFQTIARLQNVSRASEVLNLSQPALTQAVKKLEAQFGATLLERGSRGSFLTEHGAIVRDRISRLLLQLESALHETFVGGPNGHSAAARQLADRVTMTQVRALIAIDRHGSLAEAARSLGVSVPALHRAAHDLETIGRRTLFHRTSEGVRTSRAGVELARRLQILLRELDYAAEELDTARGQARARIIIGTLPFSRATLLAHVINALVDEFPDTRIYMTEGVYDLLLSMLRDGRIDFIYGMLRRPDWATDVVERPLFNDPYAIVVRRGHPLTQCAEITLEQLAAFDWIVGGPWSIRRQTTERIFDGLGRLPRTSIEATSPKAVRALLSTSDRITLLTRLEIELEEKFGALTTINYDPKIARNADGLVTRADWRPTPVQARFISLLLEYSTEKPIDPSLV